MEKLRLEELTAKTIVSANSLTLKPGQEQFVAPVANSIAEAYVKQETAWPRVVLLEDTVVGFIMGNFDEDNEKEEFRSCILRMNVSGDVQGKGVGRFLVEEIAKEAKARGFDAVTAIWEPGELGPEAFFARVGFDIIGETEYGEIIGKKSLN
ncbi:GNAT family N-acetyltransferase [Humidisolicoccus flavus]|uniref:GNAT family N-acetyltransferase n=1 Tax=Humidisolicoccus flavus TaxID=3111414 RepID=UPI003251A165